MYKREKVRSKLVKTHGNTTELLDFEEKLLRKKHCIRSMST